MLSDVVVVVVVVAGEVVVAVGGDGLVGGDGDGLEVGDGDGLVGASVVDDEVGDEAGDVQAPMLMRNLLILAFFTLLHSDGVVG